MDSSLPFERGDTYFGSPDQALSSSGRSYSEIFNLLGRTFSVQNDGQAGVGHDTTETEIMIVRNGSGAVVPVNVAVAFGANAYDVSGVTAANGDFGHVIDDAYVKVIQPYDLFYVVVRGPVNILMATGAASAHMEKAGFGADGKVVIGALNVTGHVPGVIHGNQSSTGSDVLRLINCGHPVAIGPIG